MADQVTVGQHIMVENRLWTIEHIRPYGNRGSIILILRDGLTQTSILVSPPCKEALKHQTALA